MLLFKVTLVLYSCSCSSLNTHCLALTACSFLPLGLSCGLKCVIHKSAKFQVSERTDVDLKECNQLSLILLPKEIYSYVFIFIYFGAVEWKASFGSLGLRCWSSNRITECYSVLIGFESLNSTLTNLLDTLHDIQNIEETFLALMELLIWEARHTHEVMRAEVSKLICTAA